jgi:hypothetical protein
MQLFAFSLWAWWLHIPSARALRPLASYGRVYDHQPRIYLWFDSRVQSRSGKCFVRETIDAVYWFVVFLPTSMDTLVFFYALTSIPFWPFGRSNDMHAHAGLSKFMDRPWSAGLVCCSRLLRPNQDAETSSSTAGTDKEALYTIDWPHQLQIIVFVFTMHDGGPRPGPVLLSTLKSTRWCQLQTWKWASLLFFSYLFKSWNRLTTEYQII